MAAIDKQLFEIKNAPTPQKIGEEYDKQLTAYNPFKLMSEVFNGYSNGPLVLALGAVGGGGAGEKAKGILEQFIQDSVPFQVVAMNGYLKNNPLILKFIKEKSIRLTSINDTVPMGELYGNCLNAITELAKQKVSGVLSLGPRTYYPYAAIQAGTPSLIIDGAVPDKWDCTRDAMGLPTSPYDEETYLKAVYATTCGFSDWFPPNNKYPEGMDLRIIQQPFSGGKNKLLNVLRTTTPEEARATLLEKQTIRLLDSESIIIIPTMDQVYLNTGALSVFGNFLTSEQFGQSFASMAELITSASKLASESGRTISIYLRPGIIRNMLLPIVNEYSMNGGLTIIGPQDGVVSNTDWLLLRKAGVTIGRAPLCVSTAEALGMGDYQITSATPGRTSDGLSYMTEAEALPTLARKGIGRVIFPGEPLLPAIKEVINLKGL